MRSSLPLVLLVAASGFALAPPRPRGSYEDRPTSSGAAADITVKAMDFAFELPPVVQPGPRTIPLVNHGHGMHHVYLVRLEVGRTLAALLAAIKPGAPFPSWAKSVGGPNSPAPGGESTAVVDLVVGHYAVVCLIPDAGGQPHLMKGMAKSFEVTGALVPRTAPKATVTAVLDDYSFAISKPLAAGRQVIEFSNRAKQPHEAFLAKLAPGKTAADLLRWLSKQDGPPPGVPVGGITGIEPGSHQSIIVDLTAGNYAWFCFLPDATDGQEHVKHGMSGEFRVSPAAPGGGGMGAR